MKRFLVATIICWAIALCCAIEIVQGAGQIVDLPLISNLDDGKGNLTGGQLVRTSDATYVDTSGILTTSWGTRPQKILTGDQNDDTNWPLTITVLVDTTYVLSTDTSGATVTVAEDTATLSSTGSATYGTAFPFTCTVAGDITLSVSGSSTPRAMLEQLPSGNTIGSDLFDQETTTTREAAYDTVAGTVYRIVTQNTLDFTSVGAADNNVGTIFIADAVDTLGAGDELDEVTAPHKGTLEWPYLAGAELITDTTLGTDIMTKGTGWTHDAGNTQYDCSGAQGADSDLTENVITGAGLIRVEFTVSNYSAGNVTALADTTEGTDVSSDDTFVQYVYADSAGVAGVRADSSFIGSIDDISIRPVQFSWTAQGNNTMELDETEDALKITYVDNDDGARLQLNDAKDLTSNLTVGEAYLVSATAKGNQANPGDLGVYNGTAFSGTAVTTSWVSYEFVFTAQSTTLCNIRANGMAAGDIIYIKDLTLQSIPDIAMLEPADFVNSATVPARPRYEADGLAIDPEGTNLLEYSEDFSQWTNSNTTDTADIVGPGGNANSATTLTASAGNGTLKYAVSPTLAGTADTFSIWMKRITGTGNVDLTEDDGSTWSTKTLTSSWQRFDVSGTETNPVVGIRIVTSADAAGIFGAQIEETPYPTSYIPTDGSMATRTSEAADGTYGFEFDMSATVQNALASGTIAGTLIAEITPGFATADGSGTGSSFISVAAAAESILYYDFTNNDIQSTDGTTDILVDEAMVNGTTFKMAVRWSDANNTFVVSDDQGSGSWEHSKAEGSEDALDAGGFVITGNKLYFGYGMEYPFHIKSLRIYDGSITYAGIENEVWDKTMIVFPPFIWMSVPKAIPYE